MPKIQSQERVREYTREIKVSLVKLTEGLDIKTTEIAAILDLHPVMLYRWRQEYREGNLSFRPTKKVSMTLEPSNKPPPTRKQLDKIERLKQENARLKKEVNVLKKLQRYLASQNKNDSDS